MTGKPERAGTLAAGGRASSGARAMKAFSIT
jgi:hypothetical protein